VIIIIIIIIIIDKFCGLSGVSYCKVYGKCQKKKKKTMIIINNDK